MQISTTTNGTTTTLALDGWLDTSSAPQLAQALSELDPNCAELVLDFAKLEYISSAGLRQIVAAYKRMRGSLAVTNVSAEVMQVIHMAGIDKRVNVS